MIIVCLTQPLTTFRIHIKYRKLDFIPTNSSLDRNGISIKYSPHQAFSQRFSPISSIATFPTHKATPKQKRQISSLHKTGCAPGAARVGKLPARPINLPQQAADAAREKNGNSSFLNSESPLFLSYVFRLHTHAHAHTR